MVISVRAPKVPRYYVPACTRSNGAKSAGLFVSGYSRWPYAKLRTYNLPTYCISSILVSRLVTAAHTVRAFVVRTELKNTSKYFHTKRELSKLKLWSWNSQSTLYVLYRTSTPGTVLGTYASHYCDHRQIIMRAQTKLVPKVPLVWLDKTAYS